MRFEPKAKTQLLLAGIAVLVVLGLVSGCAGGEQKETTADKPETDSRPLVKTTCYPMDWLVRELAGQRVRRELIIPKGEDPPFWQPGVRTVADLQDADLILANGAGYEAWMRTATLPVGKVVYTAEGLDLIELEGETHSHGAQGEHSHTGTDPHTWLDPNLFQKQAERAVEELIRIDPDHGEAYSTGLTQLIPVLVELDEDYDKLFDEMDNDVALAANHPAYNYLASRYGVPVVSFSLDPADISSPEAIQEVVEWQRTVEQAVLLWEEPPTPEVQSSLPGNIRHVFVDPLEQPPEQGPYDYVKQARDNISRLRDAIVVVE
jgi:zinc transport system substrate-binding protein